MNLLRHVFLSLFLVLAFPASPSFSASEPPKDCETRPFDRGRLWQVSQLNTPPSYVFGTMHSKDPRILFIPGIVMQAFTGASVVLLETSLNDENIATSRARMFGTAQFSLKQALGDDRFARLEKIISTYGISAAALDKLKIWAAASIISQPPQSRNKNAKKLTLLDRELEKTAYQMKKQVFPLETMAEQLSLFDTMSQQTQVEFLDQAINEFPNLDSEIDRMSNHYLAGRTGWIYCDLENTLDEVSPALVSFMQGALINERNTNMVNRMMPYLKKGGSFVAIGALHLPGDKGILSLLQAQGFKIQKKY